MGRKPCCDKEGLNKGAWSAEEDKILTNYIEINGEGKWRDLPQRAGLNRCGKSCRLRWLNYLRPDIKRGNISSEEEELIIRLHKLLGNRWSLIAGRLPGRTDNEIKNYWNTTLSKKTEQRSDKAPHHERTSTSTSKEYAPKPEPASKSHQTVQVIRTKAFKCRKVVLPSHLDGHDQMVDRLNLNPGLIPCESSSSSVSQNLQEDSPLCGFLIDFDIDDVFISDLLYPNYFLQDQINKCDQEMEDGITKLEDFMGDEALVENWVDRLNENFGFVPCESSSLSASQDLQEDSPPCGFLIDFDIEDLFISDLLNTENILQDQINKCDQEMEDGITKLEDLMGDEALVENWVDRLNVNPGFVLCESSSSSTSQDPQKDSPPCDFLIDLGIDDLFISDLLNTDNFLQDQINECDQEMEDGITKLEDLMGDEALVENWKASVHDHHDDQIFQRNDGDQDRVHDLNAISSFLNLEGDHEKWNSN